MRYSRLYMIFLGVALLIVFLMEYSAKQQFRWTPTFDSRDHEPFGSYVFDDVVSSSVDDYTVVNKTLYQLATEDSFPAPHAFLLTETGAPFTEIDIKALYQLLGAGNRIMLCASFFSDALQDSVCFSVNFQYLWLNNNAYSAHAARDTVFFGTDTLNPDCIYEVYPQMCRSSIVSGRRSRETETHDSLFNISDSIPDADSLQDSCVEAKVEKAVVIPVRCDSMEILARNSARQPLAMRLFIDSGELYIVSTPLMFTNFAVLDESCAPYAFRLLSYLKDLPLVRTEAYGAHSRKSNSPLRYLLATPPLRWAVYAGMTLLLLFMIAAARRRQRAIPVVAAAPNRMMGYVSLISDLYFQRHDNGEILKMKYATFCAEVKRATGVDLQENTPNESDCKRIAERTGVAVDRLTALLQNMQMAVYRSAASDKALAHYIDSMNELLNALKQALL